MNKISIDIMNSVYALIVWTLLSYVSLVLMGAMAAEWYTLCGYILFLGTALFALCMTIGAMYFLVVSAINSISVEVAHVEGDDVETKDTPLH